MAMQHRDFKVADGKLQAVDGKAHYADQLNLVFRNRRDAWRLLESLVVQLQMVDDTDVVCSLVGQLGEPYED